MVADRFTHALAEVAQLHGIRGFCLSYFWVPVAARVLTAFEVTDNTRSTEIADAGADAGLVVRFAGALKHAAQAETLARWYPLDPHWLAIATQLCTQFTITEHAPDTEAGERDG